MNLLSVLSCLSLLLVAAAAQSPKPCVSPALMSGEFSMMVADGYVSSTGKMSYDAIGKRVRARQFGTIGGNKTFTMDHLMLFNQKIYYEIDWFKLSCKKKPLDTGFIPMAVPTDAKLMGQVFVGSSSSWGMGVLTNTWYGSLSPNAHYMSTFTEIGCIPMTFSTSSPQHGWTTISTFNWVIGNTNPMEYIPPFFCAKTKVEETDKPENFFTVLESLAMKSKAAQ